MKSIGMITLFIALLLLSVSCSHLNSDPAASLEATYKKLLIGKWNIQSKHDIHVPAITQYKKDGSVSYIIGQKVTSSGIWELNNGYLRTKILQPEYCSNKDWVTRKIIRLTKTEIITQAEGKNPSAGVRIK